MAEALVLQIKESLEDANNELPIIGGWSFDIYARGSKQGVSKFTFGLGAITTIAISNGVFYSDAEAQNSLGNKTQGKVGSNTLYFKMTGNKGKITIYASNNIAYLGLGSTQVVESIPLGGTNSPYCDICLDFLPKNINTLFNGWCVTSGDINGLVKVLGLANINLVLSAGLQNNFYGVMKGAAKNIGYYAIGNSKQKTTIDLDVLRGADIGMSGQNLTITGNLNKVRNDILRLDISTVEKNGIQGAFTDLTNKTAMYRIRMIGNTSIYPSDIKDLPTALRFIDFRDLTTMVYTGSYAWNQNLTTLNFQKSAISLATIEKILKEIDAKVSADATTGKSISLLCNEDINLSSAAQTARTSLTGKGFAINLNRI